MITALIGATTLIASIVWNAVGFAIVFGLIMLLTLREFYGLARKSGSDPFEIWGLVLAAVFYFILFSSFEGNVERDVYWLYYSVFISFLIPIN